LFLAQLRREATASLRSFSEALNPLVFTPDGRYFALGEDLGPAWSIGISTA